MRIVTSLPQHVRVNPPRRVSRRQTPGTDHDPNRIVANRVPFTTPPDGETGFAVPVSFSAVASDRCRNPIPDHVRRAGFWPTDRLVRIAACRRCAVAHLPDESLKGVALGTGDHILDHEPPPFGVGRPRTLEFDLVILPLVRGGRLLDRLRLLGQLAQAERSGRFEGVSIPTAHQVDCHRTDQRHQRPQGAKAPKHANLTDLRREADTRAGVKLYLQCLENNTSIQKAVFLTFCTKYCFTYKTGNYSR